jgi:C-3',4' desaturase CrtD
MPRIVIIGAGVGGLTTAAVLARAGLHVTVLEAHIYPGGCAGTFYHQGYRFEAGATLAGGFYPGGPMDRVAQAAGIPAWPIHRDDPALVVHLPDGSQVARWSGPERHAARCKAFGAAGEAFWRWQERTADALWDLALRLPSWPPQTPGEAAHLIGDGLAWLGADWRRISPSLAADALRPVAAHLQGAPERLRQFVDGQLLISAQATSVHANALYGAAALDLPRRGVVHLEGGIGRIADELAAAIQRHGGRVIHRQQVTCIVREGDRPVAVETKKGKTFPADIVIANLTPWNVAELLGADLPPVLRGLPAGPPDGWGAFVIYAGLDAAAVPVLGALHHQVLVREPLGEGNSVFLSLSPTWDASRAPEGRSALTISTHTRLDPWWRLHDQDEAAYEARKAAYVARMLDAAVVALPGLREAADLILPGTPVTFARFTHRHRGWVGGFPQTSLFRTWGPRLAPGLWLVGDSIFPGQSTAAVALGGLRVARGILAGLGVDLAAGQAAQPMTAPAGLD